LEYGGHQVCSGVSVGMSQISQLTAFDFLEQNTFWREEEKKLEAAEMYFYR
jgi:hypothetical protein